MNQHLLPDKTEIETAIGLGRNANHRRWVRRAAWALAVLAVVGGSYYYFEQRRQKSNTVTYDTQPAATRDLTVTISATGTIQPVTQVDVGSELSGVAREVLVDENSVVKAGDVLARLDKTRLVAQLGKATAQLQAARARVITAEASRSQAALALTRQSRLRARGLSTEQDAEQTDAELKRATASLTAADADVAAAQADLALVQTDVLKADIVSPINGIVLKRTVEPGQTVAASLQAPVLFTIAQDITRIQVEVNVDEADVGIVKVGQTAAFNVDAYRDRSFPAKIERMSFSPETVDGVVTYKTTLSADNADMSLRPGMTATAKITTAEFKNVMVVPNETLRFAPPRVAPSQGFSITQIFMPRFPRNDRGKRQIEADGKRSIYILENGAPREVRVKAAATDGKFTMIDTSEVKTGDALITASRQGNGQ
jgi:HlyD family secretion protein